jgi:hypothetical protein
MVLLWISSPSNSSPLFLSYQPNLIPPHGQIGLLAVAAGKRKQA